MAAKALPTKYELDQLLDYDPATGILRWKPRPASMFPATVRSSEDNAKAWNAKNAGREAFNTQCAEYLYGRIFGVRIAAHRAIWCMCTGEWPADQIDHIDGDAHNNRFENLRAVTASENQKNKPIQSNNRSGVIGVFWHKGMSKWCAAIKLNRQVRVIGYFAAKAAAAAARKAAEVELGFHQNHGRPRNARSARQGHKRSG